MLWILIGVGLALGALLVLVLATFHLWRTGRAFSRAVGDAGDRVGAASAKIPPLQQRSAPSSR